MRAQSSGIRGNLARDCSDDLCKNLLNDIIDVLNKSRRTIQYT
ncbi:MAG: hypothetical protein QXS70_07470 [Desulfurococcaceae archaeon]